MPFQWTWWVVFALSFAWAWTCNATSSPALPECAWAYNWRQFSKKSELGVVLTVWFHALLDGTNGFLGYTSNRPTYASERKEIQRWLDRQKNIDHYCIETCMFPLSCVIRCIDQVNRVVEVFRAHFPRHDLFDPPTCTYNLSNPEHRLKAVVRELYKIRTLHCQCLNRGNIVHDRCDYLFNFRLDQVNEKYGVKVGTVDVEKSVSCQRLNS
jgi:hypothetical protein